MEFRKCSSRMGRLPNYLDTNTSYFASTLSHAALLLRVNSTRPFEKAPPADVFRLLVDPKRTISWSNPHGPRGIPSWCGTRHNNIQSGRKPSVRENPLPFSLPLNLDILQSPLFFGSPIQSRPPCRNHTRIVFYACSTSMTIIHRLCCLRRCAAIA